VYNHDPGAAYPDGITCLKSLQAVGHSALLYGQAMLLNGNRIMLQNNELRHNQSLGDAIA
jgi:hypothetical protein